MAVSLATKPTSSSKVSLLLIILGGVVVVGGGIYWYISYSSTPADSVIVSSSGEAPSETVANTAPQSDTELDKQAGEVLAAVALIKKIQLDTKFFEDSRFTALKETPIDIPEVKPSGHYQFRFAAPPSDKDKKK